MVPLERRLEERANKTIKGRYDRGQVGKLGTSRSSHECCLLNLLLSVVSELAGQRERTLARDLDTSARERRRDCKPHRLSVERSCLDHPMDIEELHPAVCQREPHHCFGLLGNRGVWPIGTQSGAREVERDDVHAGEGETLEESCCVLLVPAETVQGLRETTSNRPFERVAHQRLEYRSEANWRRDRR